MTGEIGLPQGEQRRLESLRRLDVLDLPAGEEYADIVTLVGRLVEAPFAAITFVDAERAWSGAVVGVPGPVEVQRSASPAARAIAGDGHVMEVELTDQAFADHPMMQAVQRPRRAAAAVISSPDGQAVGAVEAAWADDRELDDRSRRILRRMAHHVARLLELRGEADEYRRFIDLSPDAVAVLDLDGNIELANPALSDLLDLADAGDLVGHAFLELVVPEDRTRVATELARVLFARRHTTRLDMGLLRADGRPVLCSVTAGHLRSSRRSLQLSIRDLDERIRAEAERSRLSEQLAQAQRLDLAGQLASGLAHDLNNLLVIMTSNLDLAEETVRRLEAGEDGIRPLSEDLGQLRVAVDRAGDLTTKLMRFARREPGTVGSVVLATKLANVERLVDAALGEDVRLVVELEGDLPEMAVDPVQLEQALVNLVFNAADALPDGGTITVRAVRIAPHMRISGDRLEDERDEHVYLEVSDDGIGMDEETRARAFEPLFTTKRAGKGSGLGLPTVLSFVQEVGGVMDLRSTPGEGTTVSLLLPAAPRTGEPLAPETDTRTLVGGARVLLVDPGEQARRVVTRMLEGSGYRVTAVATAGEATDVVEEHGTDVLITDMVLPDGSGWRLVEHVRGKLPELPVALFVASEAAADVEGMRTLVKPFSHERLLRTLRELLAPTR